MSWNEEIQILFHTAAHAKQMLELIADYIEMLSRMQRVGGYL
jgi:hypothetical protein